MQHEKGLTIFPDLSVHFVYVTQLLCWKAGLKVPKQPPSTAAYLHGLLQHSASLYLEEIHVPLIVWGAANIPAGKVINSPVSLTALPATILSLVNSSDEIFPGPSLALIMTDANTGANWPDPISEVAQMDGAKSAGEFWHALGIAPRPYFNWSTANDDIFPNTGNLTWIYDQLRGVYVLHGRTDAFAGRLAPGAHLFPVQARKEVYDWIARQFGIGSGVATPPIP